LYDFYNKYTDITVHSVLTQMTAIRTVSTSLLQCNCHQWPNMKGHTSNAITWDVTHTVNTMWRYSKSQTASRRHNATDQQHAVSVNVAVCQRDKGTRTVNMALMYNQTRLIRNFAKRLHRSCRNQARR